jgi:hypothetical protein
MPDLTESLRICHTTFKRPTAAQRASGGRVAFEPVSQFALVPPQPAQFLGHNPFGASHLGSADSAHVDFRDYSDMLTPMKHGNGRTVAFAAALVISLTAAPGKAALTVSTNFEGGSAKVVAISDNPQSVQIEPGGNPERGWPCWWFFRVDGVNASQPLEVKVTATRAMLPANKDKPARKLSPDWSLPRRAAVSGDGRAWDRTAPGERHGSTTMYRIPVPSGTVWIAWGPPFGPTDAANFITNLARAHPFVKPFTLAVSREGRQAPAIRFIEGDRPVGQRSGVWIIARQHAWEVGGSWVGVGFAEWLAGESGPAQWVRQNAEVFFVPIMDVDDVATGDGGKECLPQDPNKDWSATPHFAEVAAVEKGVLALAKEGRMDLLIDLHNPGASKKEVTLWITPTNYLSAQAAANQNQLFAIMQREVTEPLSVAAEPVWDGPGPNWATLSCPWVYHHGNPQTVAITVETAWNTAAGTTAGYRVVGQRLGVAMASYLRNRSSGPAKPN